MSLTLQVNMLIEWDPVEGEQSLVERILFIDPSSNDVVTIYVNDEKAFPKFKRLEDLRRAIIGDHARILFKAEQYAGPSLPDSEDHPKYAEYIRRRDEAWELIAPLVEIQDHKIFNRRERGRLVAELTKRTGRRKETIYDYLRRYWQRGFTKDALIPAWHNCGHPKDGKERGIKKKLGRKSADALRTGVDTGRNVTEEDKENFKKGIKRFINTGKARDLPEAWQLIKERYYSEGTYDLESGAKAPLIKPANDLPTFRQFEYYYRQNRNPTAELIGKYGQLEYDRNNRPILDDAARMAFGPGAVYQVDATVGDIYLLSYLGQRLIIGRPVIYFVIDVFSRLVVGFAVTLEGPSWEGLRLALECAFMNKVAFCQRFGINISEDQWPVEGLCQALLGDNGEIKGYNANNLVDPLEIRVINAAVGRPDLKPIVERRFRMINDLFIKWQPGAVRPRREVKGKDYRLEAKLDLDQFRRMMIKCILYYNNSYWMKKYRKDEFMIPAKVEPVPIKLWNYGIQRTGKLRWESAEKIHLNLLPRGKASTTPQGICYEGLHYICSMAMEEQWFTRYKGKRTIRLNIVSEPLVDRIHLRLDRGRRYVTCELSPADQRFKGRDWYEIKEFFALEKKARNDAETKIQQSQAEFHAEINSIIDEGTKMTNKALAEAGLSKRARIEGISSRRKKLKSHERKRGADNSVEEESPETQSQAPAHVFSINELSKHSTDEKYVPPVRHYDELRESWREEQEKERKDAK